MSVIVGSIALVSLKPWRPLLEVGRCLERSAGSGSIHIIHSPRTGRALNEVQHQSKFTALPKVQHQSKFTALPKVQHQSKFTTLPTVQHQSKFNVVIVKIVKSNFIINVKDSVSVSPKYPVTLN